MPFIDVDEDNFDAVMSREFEKEKFVILKFGSYYCDACQIMDMELEELCDRLANVSVLSIDSGKSEYLTQRYFVEEVPTTLIFKEAEKQLFYRTGITLADDMIDVILKEC
ncbi:thioredoxin family protein [Sulfurimonas sp. SWIR-19]|uniref:thioredoxin family protein n=1 Tax=Sulfurimonas sp. SWIR-19 TaxID=2878390 RepID=UPI001CF44BA2|nr:thioredoxin family protein [Sulfurimonas sp. SWIR-19]UCN00931.1 thioredoxin family protein [Sulfurimonas sp. SWIR-19]